MTKVEDGVRLQKFLSRAGIASRRSSEGLILQGRVRVNGVRVTELGTRVHPESDRVEVDGTVVSRDPPRWILLHKPRGVVTTLRDPQQRPTVYSLLERSDRALRYVGRLDLETEGLLLFTNEGDALHRLTHPSSEIPREYRVGVVGVPEREKLAQLAQGVELEDGPAHAEEVRLLRLLPGGKGAILALVLKEGRKREVRRMIEAIGHSVHRLRRVAFGPVQLGDLKPGEWRVLTQAEIRALREVAEKGAGSPAEAMIQSGRGAREERELKPSRGPKPSGGSKPSGGPGPAGAPKPRRDSKPSRGPEPRRGSGSRGR